MVMKPVVRVEIVIGVHHVPQVIRALESMGLPHYSHVPHVVGRGDRGERSGEELTGTFTNALLLTTCEPENAESVAQTIEPLLKQFGGVCLLTDSREVEH